MDILGIREVRKNQNTVQIPNVILLIGIHHVNNKLNAYMFRIGNLTRGGNIENNKLMGLSLFVLNKSEDAVILEEYIVKYFDFLDGFIHFITEDDIRMGKNLVNVDSYIMSYDVNKINEIRTNSEE